MAGSKHADVFVVDLYYEPDAMARPQVPPPAPTPEGFEVFCLVMERIDDNFAKTRLKVRRVLVDEDYLQPSSFDKHALGYEQADFTSDDSDEDYDTVAISYNEESHEIEILIPVNVPRDVWDTFESKVVEGRFRHPPPGMNMRLADTDSLSSASKQVLTKTIEQMRSANRQQELPDLQESDWTYMTVRGYISSSLTIELDGNDKDREVNEAYRVAKLVDDNFEEFKELYIENIKNYSTDKEEQKVPLVAPNSQVNLDPHPERADPVWEGRRRKKRMRSKHHKKVTGISNEPYQRMARKRFGKAMRLTVKGPQRTMPKGWKVINPVPGKSGPPGE